ncbi:MAG TPA: mechanosensitive ion channel family protein [Candidatus Acidoferrales bacterium]|jgi:MscS family membrane protein|nr:mechanosensitive ion channel family protein [Candidatus Acidoferrales bacterium]
MRFRFETIYRTSLVVLFLTAFWAVWASAQTNQLRAANDALTATATNNAPDANGTNVVAKVGEVIEKDLESPDWIKHLAKDWPFLRYHFWGNELWKYLFSLIYIFLAFYISKLLDYLTRVWLKRWTDKTKTKLDDLLLNLLNGPVKVISFVIFLRIGLDVFQWPGLVQKILTKGFTVVVAVTITYAVLKLVDLLMNFWHLRANADSDQEFHEQIFPIIRKALKVFVVVVGLLMTLSALHIDITAAIASLSIGGLAVGLAAQDTLANLFGAVAIFLDRPFRIGDRIKVETVEGMVETIGLRSTRVRNLDGHHVTIPNKLMGNAIITNVTRRPNIKTEMNLGLTYDTPSEKVRRATAILEEIFRANPKTTDLVITFNKFGDSALNILVVHVWNGTDAKTHLAEMQEMNLQIKSRFEAEKIEFAFPTQTIFLKQDGTK